MHTYIHTYFCMTKGIISKVKEKWRLGKIYATYTMVDS